MSLKSLLFSKNIEFIANKYKIFIFSFFLSIFIFGTILASFNTNNLSKENRVFQLTKIVNKFEKKNENIDLLVTMVSLEKYIKENIIKIVSMKLLNKGFSLKLQGEYKSTIKIVDLIEKKSSLLKIEQIIVSYDKNKKLANLFLDVKVLKNSKLYKKEKKQSPLVNAFEINNQVQIEESKVYKKIEKIKILKLYAIVENMVNINNKWFKVGESIDSKKIVFIGKDFIKLKTENRVLKLWMYKNEFVR